MTVDEIKRELDDLGVEYPPDARKPELEEMLAKAAEGAATAPETPAPDPERIRRDLARRSGRGVALWPPTRARSTSAASPAERCSRWCPTAPSSRQSAIRRTAGSAW